MIDAICPELHYDLWDRRYCDSAKIPQEATALHHEFRLAEYQSMDATNQLIFEVKFEDGWHQLNTSNLYKMAEYASRLFSYTCPVTKAVKPMKVDMGTVRQYVIEVTKQHTTGSISTQANDARIAKERELSHEA